MNLDNDATVKDAADVVSEPEKFLRLMIKNANECFNQHGNAFVRVGVTGRGTTPRPNHMVVYDTSDGEREFGRFATFEGNQPFRPDEMKDEKRWSSERTSYEEVRRLLAKLTGRPEPSPLVSKQG